MRHGASKNEGSQFLTDSFIEKQTRYNNPVGSVTSKPNSEHQRFTAHSNDVALMMASDSKQLMDVDDLNTSMNSSLKNANETQGVMQMQPMSLENPNILNHFNLMHAGRQQPRDMSPMSPMNPY